LSALQHGGCAAGWPVSQGLGKRQAGMLTC
jgi:hypothetical protein